MTVIFSINIVNNNIKPGLVKKKKKSSLVNLIDPNLFSEYINIWIVDVMFVIYHNNRSERSVMGKKILSIWEIMLLFLQTQWKRNTVGAKKKEAMSALFFRWPCGMALNKWFYWIKLNFSLIKEVKRKACGVVGLPRRGSTRSMYSVSWMWAHRIKSPNRHYLWTQL